MFDFLKKNFFTWWVNFRDPVGILILCLKKPKHITWITLGMCVCLAQG